jgi:hypothetical protein
VHGKAFLVIRISSLPNCYNYLCMYIVHRQLQNAQRTGQTKCFCQIEIAIPSPPTSSSLFFTISRYMFITSVVCVVLIVTHISAPTAALHIPIIDRHYKTHLQPKSPCLQPERLTTAPILPMSQVMDVLQRRNTSHTY